MTEPNFLTFSTSSEENVEKSVDFNKYLILKLTTKLSWRTFSFNDTLSGTKIMNSNDDHSYHFYPIGLLCFITRWRLKNSIFIKYSSRQIIRFLTEANFLTFSTNDEKHVEKTTRKYHKHFQITFNHKWSNCWLVVERMRKKMSEKRFSVHGSSGLFCKEFKFRICWWKLCDKVDRCKESMVKAF